MRLRNSLGAIAAAVLLAAGLITAGTSKDAPKEDVAAIAKALVVRNLEALNKEDVDGSMATIHRESPIYASTRQAMAGAAARYDLRYELLSFGYIGADEEYAVARVSQKTSKLQGPGFRDNVIDMMHVFRKHKGAWKFWQSALLGVTYLRPAPAPKDEAPGAGR